MQLTEPKTRTWTVAEYYQMAELGFFQDQRVELIAGEIVQMAPQGNPHYMSIHCLASQFTALFGDRYWVRLQAPLRLTSDSEPEPDVAVVTGSYKDYSTNNPTTALMVAEVSDATLRYDRTVKASLYASAGIADYWIVNLVDRQLEVRRNPVADATQKFGWKYSQVLIFGPDDAASPVALPDARIVVAEILP